MTVSSPGERPSSNGDGVSLPAHIVHIVVATSYAARWTNPRLPGIAAAKKQPNTRLELFRRHGLLVIITGLIFAGNNAAGYMATGGFIPSYASSPAVADERTDVLLAVTYGAGVWLAFTTSPDTSRTGSAASTPTS